MDSPGVSKLGDKPDHPISVKEEVYVSDGICYDTKYKPHEISTVDIKEEPVEEKVLLPSVTSKLDDYGYEVDTEGPSSEVSDQNLLDRIVSDKTSTVSDLKEWQPLLSCPHCTTFRSFERRVLTNHINKKHAIENIRRAVIRSKLLKKKKPLVTKLECEKCSFKAHRAASLKSHMKNKHSESPFYECDECDYKTFLESRLHNHKKSMHVSEQEVKCEQCRVKGSCKTHLKQMQTLHPEVNMYKCGRCNFETNTKSMLDHHTKRNHFNKLKCDQCGYQTLWQSFYDQHLKAVHLKLKDFKCTECSFQTSFRSNLYKHMEFVHSSLTKIAVLNCGKCRFECVDKNEMVEHKMKSHVNVYNCGQCSFKTRKVQSLRNHMTIFHLEEKKAKCSLCAFEDTGNLTLEEHMEKIHTIFQVFKCDRCNFITNEEPDFTTHVKQCYIKKCNAALKYKCTFCSFMSSEKLNLLRHMRAVHSDKTSSA